MADVAKALQPGKLQLQNPISSRRPPLLRVFDRRAGPRNISLWPALPYLVDGERECRSQ